MASSADAASMPWSFTQHQPLSTADFIKEEGRRGIELRPLTLRAPDRTKVLQPFLYLADR